ncbi:MAG: hypothetical protein C0407_14230 [Desulfobacca sp.]|nr:hypothetical protein [Desulfobacca sp.]
MVLAKSKGVFRRFFKIILIDNQLKILLKTRKYLILTQRRAIPVIFRVQKGLYNRIKKGKMLSYNLESRKSGSARHSLFPEKNTHI